LLPRVQQAAVREFSRDPDLSMEEFERRMGAEFFEDRSASANTKDLLELQRIWNFESEWYWASPLTDPQFFRERCRRLKWPAEKLAEYDRHLARLKEIAERYSGATNPREARMAVLAGGVVQAWGSQKPSDAATR
jgi:hypothetical protein